MTKTGLHILFILLLTATTIRAQQWSTHLAYNDAKQVLVTSDKAFLLSNNNVLSINKLTDERQFYGPQDGLSRGKIAMLAYDSVRNEVLFFHENGYLDLLNSQGIRTISDLYLKDMTQNKCVICSSQHGDMLYLGMPFGILTYSLSLGAFVDTYFIGEEASEVAVTSIALSSTHIYAATENDVYCASLDSNLVDYRYWHTLPHQSGNIHGMAILNGQPVVVWGETLYQWNGSTWTPLSQVAVTMLTSSNGHALATLKNGGLMDLNVSTSTTIAANRQVAAVGYDNQRTDYWLADNHTGILHEAITGEQVYAINGPAVNIPYRMTYGSNRLYVVQGGRWATRYWRTAYVMMYDGTWHNTQLTYPQAPLQYEVQDLVDVIVDPNDDAHYFLASYGQGVIEMQNDSIVAHYMQDNSTLRDATAGLEPDKYTFADCFNWDENNNLWLVNGHFGLCARQPDGTWHAFDLQDASGQPTNMYTPCRLMLDPLHANRLWVTTCRVGSGLGVYDHAGTLADKTDDQTIFHRTFQSENGAELDFELMYDADVDAEGNVWLATQKGLYYYPATQDIFTQNTLLHPGIMPGDADYLLKDEPVSAIRVDRFNRKWIGTENLGVYVLSANNDSLLYHFTTANSTLPSNSIPSIAHHPTQRITMIGTSAGIAEVSEEQPTAVSHELWEDMTTDQFSGMMNGWTYHFSYSQTTEIAQVGNLIYALANGSLYSFNTEDEELRPVNQLNGLNGAEIGHIIAANNNLIVAYTDGLIDLIDSDENIRTLTDLKNKPLSGVSKLMHDAVCQNGRLYIATDFGVLVLHTGKVEFSEWFNPLPEGNPMLEHISISGDSLFAASSGTLYSGSLRNNLSDYNFWHSQPLSERPDKVESLHFLSTLQYAGCTYTADNELLRTCNGQQTRFAMNGPAVNTPYRVSCAEDQVVVVPGGRRSAVYERDAVVMRLKDGQWSNIPNYYLVSRTTLGVVKDFTRTAFDPADPNHYYISSFGMGLWEFRGEEVIANYTLDNSPIISAVSLPYYQFCDGVATDADGNVWVLNGYNKTCLLVKSPEGQWGKLAVKQGSSTANIYNPGDILIDNTNPNRKWLVSSRATAGIALLDDGGTPFDPSDDKSMFRTTLTDNRGKYASLDAIYSIAQDLDGNVWVGTGEGPRVLAAGTDFIHSDKCIRPVINRTDGSNLADYVLGTERLNAIAVDGGNRIWFGTQASGVYLMKIDLQDAENTETIYHFTTANSPLPSNTIVSIAIRPSDGEVFFGTDGGLVSFKSDASEGKEDYSSAYAYPNPVRPNFQGVLTVTDLMENSEVRITNAAGQLVFTGTANGGTITWNLHDGTGKRVKTGVYLVMCHSEAEAEEKGHAIIKVLVM